MLSGSWFGPALLPLDWNNVPLIITIIKLLNQSIGPNPLEMLKGLKWAVYRRKPAGIQVEDAL